MLLRPAHRIQDILKNIVELIENLGVRKTRCEARTQTIELLLGFVLCGIVEPLSMSPLTPVEGRYAYRQQIDKNGENAAKTNDFTAFLTINKTFLAKPKKQDLLIVDC